MIDMTVNMLGMEMPSPVMPASGTVDEKNLGLVDYRRLGAWLTKGVTVKPRPGNLNPRIAEVPFGALNSIGLANVGIDEFIRSVLPELLRLGMNVIVNISGTEVQDYVILAQRLDQTNVAALEVNISCPNIKGGGMAFGTDILNTAKVVSEVRKITTKPLIIKLTPQATQIAAIAKVCEEEGADAISAINTVTATDINIKTGQFVLGAGFGGMSGEVILPIALQKVREIYQAVKIPIIGIGGIACLESAIKMFMAGASAIQIGTANFAKPDIMIDIIDGVTEWLESHGHTSVSDIVGTARVPD